MHICIYLMFSERYACIWLMRAAAGLLKRTPCQSCMDAICVATSASADSVVEKPSASESQA